MAFALQEASRVLTAAEKEAQRQRIKEEKKSLIDASEERKNHMQEMEMLRRENEKLSDLEQVCLRLLSAGQSPNARSASNF